MDQPPGGDKQLPYGLPNLPLGLPGQVPLNFGNPLLFNPQALPPLGVPNLFSPNALLGLNPLLGAAQLGIPGLGPGIPSLETLIASGIFPGSPLLSMMPGVPPPPTSMFDSVEHLLKAAENSALAPLPPILNFAPNSLTPEAPLPFQLTAPKESASSAMRTDTPISETNSALGMVDPSVDSDSASWDSESEDIRPKSSADASGGHSDSAASGSGYGTRSKSKRLVSVGSSSRPSHSRQSSAGEIESPAVEMEEETATETSEWDQLEVPLPSIELPKLPPYVHPLLFSSSLKMLYQVNSNPPNPCRCSLDDRLGIFSHNLLMVDAGAPALLDLDSPETWRCSLAPVNAEWTKRVLLPRYLSRQLGTSSITSLSTIVPQRPSNRPLAPAVSNSSLASQQNKKKRSRQQIADDGAEAYVGEIDEPSAPNTKRSKSEDPERSKHVRFEGADHHGEGEEPSESALGPAAMKRRMSKGDEAVEVKRSPDGKVEMPIQFVSLTVTSLGEIVYSAEKFHSRRYIFPLGYTSKRSYYSLKDPTKRCEYTQEVIANPKQSNEPQFRLICEDDALNPITSSTPSGVWSEVLERIKPQREAIVGRTLHSTISGPEQFGFSHPIIHALIEELPNADRCANYDRSAFFIPDARGKRKSKGPAPGVEEEE